jgi:hypothetical protein
MYFADAVNQNRAQDPCGRANFQWQTCASAPLVIAKSVKYITILQCIKRNICTQSPSDSPG